MGTLGGHLLPGSFFIILGLWWSFITAIRYAQMKMRTPHKKSGIVGYKTTVTMPFIILPCVGLRRAPVESYLKAFFAFVGLLGEVITGFHIYQVPKAEFDLMKAATTGSNSEGSHDHHEHEHRRREAGPASPSIPEIYVTKWYFEYVNAQHITMYSAFILGAVVEIMRYHRVDLPKKLEHVLGALAFGVEGFLFAFHLHSRHPLDIHVHVLLVYAIYGCVLFTILEIYDETQILFTYGRILCTILQGTWFFEVGFILYPPTTHPAFQWNPEDHNQIMTVTTTFCWHVMFIIIGLLVELAIIRRMYRKSKYMQNQWDELILIDSINNNEENDDFDGTSSRLGKYSQLNEPTNMETTKFLNNLNSDDELNERVEFDMRNKYKSSNGKNDTENNSTSSGHYSIEMRK
jgi:hypothetical protein